MPNLSSLKISYGSTQDGKGHYLVWEVMHSEKLPEPLCNVIRASGLKKFADALTKHDMAACEQVWTFNDTFGLPGKPKAGGEGGYPFSGSFKTWFMTLHAFEDHKGQVEILEHLQQDERMGVLGAKLQAEWDYFKNKVSDDAN